MQNSLLIERFNFNAAGGFQKKQTNYFFIALLLENTPETSAITTKKAKIVHIGNSGTADSALNTIDTVWVLKCVVYQT